MLIVVWVTSFTQVYCAPISIWWQGPPDAWAYNILQYRNKTLIIRYLNLLRIMQANLFKLCIWERHYLYYSGQQNPALFQEEYTISIFQVYLLHKHPLKCSLKENNDNILAGKWHRNMRHSWRNISQQYYCVWLNNKEIYSLQITIKLFHKNYVCLDFSKIIKYGVVKQPLYIVFVLLKVMSN